MALAISSAVPTRFIGTMWREPVRAIGLAAAGVNFGIDQAGPDRRDANAFAGDFVAEADR